MNEFSRTELLIGKEALNKLAASHVAVFGIGGVGSYAVEGLARSGVGKLTLVDFDEVDLTNINRQIHATHKTVGHPKVEVMGQRVLDINPQMQVNVYQRFYLPEKAEDLLNTDYDYIIDAVDMVTAKIDLIVSAQQMGIPIISSMGTGNKLDPSRFEIDDIYNTSICSAGQGDAQRTASTRSRLAKSGLFPEEPVKQENEEKCF
jgi:tRNA A37 threonylcarbamoyladenosine dehydratase